MSPSILDIFDDLSFSTIQRDLLSTGSYRLDASFYDPQTLEAQRTLARSGLTLQRLSEVTEVYCSNLRERTFVAPDNGVALLAGHNLDTDDDRDLKYVSRVLTRGIDRETLKQGDVLVSSAGTVGFFDFVWDNHEGRLASQHIIRIRSNEVAALPGYIYAYLSSPIALAMVTNQSAGSVIVTLYTEHLASLPLPRLDPKCEQQIHEMIVSSFQHRNRCRQLLQQARTAVLQANQLPALPTHEEEELDCYAVSQSAIQDLELELRLEAHFHNPRARMAITNIQKHTPESCTLKEVAERTFFCNRFTRTFVEATHGIPYIAGKNIVQIRPRAENYLSTAQTEDLTSYRLRRGWILITCSGTIGRTCFVWKNLEESVASHDLIRVVADTGRIDQGYLYAFLSSPYGYEQMDRFKYGSVIDHVTPEQVEKVVIPLPEISKQREIGDKVRSAYEKRADALRLEDEAQELLMGELNGTAAVEK
jgi:type I restriction enzyme S subunit